MVLLAWFQASKSCISEAIWCLGILVFEVVQFVFY